MTKWSKKPAMTISRKILISGLVQGVGFRFFTQRAAAAHQVTGYVRNLDDGRVEALAEGAEREVHSFIQDLYAGPRYSRVDDVEEIVQEYSGRYPTFRIEK